MVQNIPAVRADTRQVDRWCGVLILGAVLATACKSDAPPAKAADSVVPRVAVPAPKVPDSVVTTTPWDSAAGSAVYLPGDGGVAQLILPTVPDDSVPAPAKAPVPRGAAPASIDLFAPAGLVGTVSVGEYAAATQPDVADGCDAWPVVSLRDVGAVAAGTWRLALQSGVATALTADSIGGMTRTDSARLVVDVNRAAAMLSLDSAGMLRGVPFGVTKAYRFSLPGGVDAVAAVVERRLNVEASPRVERTTLLLERPPKAKGYTAVWRDTQFAAEDDLIAIDLLSIVTFRASSRVTAFFGLDFGDGSRIQMLQRSAGGIWTLHWSSAYTGC